MDAQLKRGALELCLLSDVAKQEQYGYDIIKRLRQSFPDVEESSFMPSSAACIGRALWSSFLVKPPAVRPGNTIESHLGGGKNWMNRRRIGRRWSLL